MSCNDLDLHWSWAPSSGEALKLGRRKSQLWPGLGPSRDYRSQDRGLHINPGQGNEPTVCQSSIRVPTESLLRLPTTPTLPAPPHLASSAAHTTSLLCQVINTLLTGPDRDSLW